MGLGLALLALSACTRGPLDSSASAPAADGPLSDGRISVTLYSGAQATGAGFVDLIRPDGSKQSLNAAPSCTFTALTQAGPYRIQFRDQAATQAAFTTVTLSPRSPCAQVLLQVGGASLQVVPVPFQAATFPFAATDFKYSVQVSQAHSNAQDLCLDIDPASLPPGWTYRFDEPVVRGNAATNLVLTTASGTTSTAVALRLRGRLGGTEWVSQGIALQRAWSLSFNSTLVSATTEWDEATWTTSCLTIYGITVHGSGLPSGQSVYLRCASCVGILGQAMPGGVLVPVNQGFQISFANSHNAFCGPDSMSLCLDGYCGPPQTL